MNILFDFIETHLIDSQYFTNLEILVIVHVKLTYETLLIIVDISDIILNYFPAISAVLSAFHSLILMYASPSGGIGSRFVMTSRWI